MPYTVANQRCVSVVACDQGGFAFSQMGLVPITTGTVQLEFDHVIKITCRINNLGNDHSEWVSVSP